jgi:hypothetical protein
MMRNVSNGSDPGVTTRRNPGPESRVKPTNQARMSAYRSKLSVAAGASQQPGLARSGHSARRLEHRRVNCDESHCHEASSHAGSLS